MSDICQIVSEVISIDDDDEDVEVVFTNLTKSKVNHNIMCRKITQEIELLQAMCKQTVPTEFNQFKEQAKKLGFQFEDDVIRSAWQRVLKKFMLKMTSFPNNTAPVCLVKPMQSNVEVSSCQTNSLISSPALSKTDFTSSTPTTSTAIPVALLLNKSMHTKNTHNKRTEYSVEQSRIVTDTNKHNQNVDLTNSNSANIELISNQERRCSQTRADFAHKNKVSIGTKSYRRNKSKTDVSSFSEIEQVGIEEPVGLQNTFLNILSNCFDQVVRGQNTANEKTEVTGAVLQKHKTLTMEVGQPKTPVNSGPESGCGSMDLDYTNVIDLSNDNYLSDLSNSYSSDLEQNQLNDLSEVLQKRSRRRKSSTKKIVPVSSPKRADQEIAKSHVGIKANIGRIKKSEPKSSGRRSSKKFKAISESELKQFKAEQKIRNYEEKCKFEMQQLQKVHDRLVEVLIPKYYNTELNSSG